MGKRRDQFWDYVVENDAGLHCMFCELQFARSTSVSRVKYHLARCKMGGISICTKVPHHVSEAAELAIDGPNKILVLLRSIRKHQAQNNTIESSSRRQSDGVENPVNGVEREATGVQGSRHDVKQWRSPVNEHLMRPFPRDTIAELSRFDWEQMIRGLMEPIDFYANGDLNVDADSTWLNNDDFACNYTIPSSSQVRNDGVENPVNDVEREGGAQRSAQVGEEWRSSFVGVGNQTENVNEAWLQPVDMGVSAFGKDAVDWNEDVNVTKDWLPPVPNYRLAPYPQMSDMNDLEYFVGEPPEMQPPFETVPLLEEGESSMVKNQALMIDEDLLPPVADDILAPVLNVSQYLNELFVHIKSALNVAEDWSLSVPNKICVLDDLQMSGMEDTKSMISDEMVQQLNPVPSEYSNSLVNGSVNGRRIGKLLLSRKKIAKGSNGTVVFEGIYDGRSVAVKRLVQTYHDVAPKEIKYLIESDGHPNIVRYHGVEYDQDFAYLALERCTCSLYDLIHVYSKSKESNKNVELLKATVESNSNVELWKANGYPSVHLIKLMRDIVSGLAHLHKLRIVHRDLKPQNVLIINGEPFVAKISDMGISKHLPSDMSTLTHETGCGTSGWLAPEQLRSGRQKRAADIFSLGSVLYFCITGGKHPFGDGVERDVNILNDRKDLSLVKNIPEAVDLFSRLLDPNPDNRPNAQDVSEHPLFWTSLERLSFLQEASDHFQRKRKLLSALQSDARVALDGKWNTRMDAKLIKELLPYRRYNYDSVGDLVRAIRNTLHHYGKFHQETKELLGEYPEGFDNYFSSQFPKLLFEVYKFVYKHCREEKWFRKYKKFPFILL